LAFGAFVLAAQVVVFFLVAVDLGAKAVDLLAGVVDFLLLGAELLAALLPCGFGRNGRFPCQSQPILLPLPAITVPNAEQFAQIGVDLVVIAGAGCLPFQRTQAWRDFAEYVIDALQIALRIFQAAQRFGAARFVMADTGGFFKEGASFFGT